MNNHEVYVGEYSNHRIEVFDTSGNYLRTWGNYGNGNGQFYAPSGLANQAGQIYVADMGNDPIQVFDKNGNFVKKWGTRGVGNGQFNNPQSIASDTQGYLYVTDTNNHRIQKFTKDGIHIKRWGSFGSNDNQFVHLLVLLSTSSTKCMLPNRHIKSRNLIMTVISLPHLVHLVLQMGSRIILMASLLIQHEGFT